MMREFAFIDGSVVTVPSDSCRGCYIKENEDSLCELLKPIIENDQIAVRQDAEFPVPGFYIVSLKEHVSSIAAVEPHLAAELGLCIHYVRKAMLETLNIEKAHIYLEEKLTGSHYHTWILPLWLDEIKKNNMNPRLWEGNIREYIGLFQYEKEKGRIESFNRLMRNSLLSIPHIKEYYQ